MTNDEVTKELDKVLRYAIELTQMKTLSITDILALIARMQCSQAKLIVHCLEEIQKLK